MNTEAIISKIRQQYALIFEWHKENGYATIERIIDSYHTSKRYSTLDEDESNKIEEYKNRQIKEYKNALDMPHPENANLEEMYLVARKVQSGILEWNYQVIIADDKICLGHIAKNIIESYKELKKQEEVEQLKDSFYEVTDYYVQSEYEYFEKSDEIYKNILLDNDRNIGGRVVIADTNWEIQKLSNNNEQVFFRKPITLHLKEIQGEFDNLFQLAFNGEISITKIIVQ